MCVVKARFRQPSVDVRHQETTEDLIQAEHRQTDQKEGKDEREEKKERAECQAALIVSILERVSVKVT